MRDVIDVLMYEYREALVRKGYRRREIDDLCARANGLLDEERESPRGKLAPYAYTRRQLRWNMTQPGTTAG